MDALRIRGGKLLNGEIQISGSKNAALPVLAGTILSDGESVIENVPNLADIRTTLKLLDGFGATTHFENNTVRVDGSGIKNVEASYELVRTMRASILVLGPLLARFGEARVSLPGGCAIGARPIDQHLKGLERMGVKIEINHGYVEAKVDKLRGAEIVFDMPTVGGTENLMLAASLAEGETVLRNAAREPEIIDLADALKSMGAQIEGAGTQRIIIQGQKTLTPMRHKVVADRIEFGTFLVAGAMMGENLTLLGGVADHQAALIDKLEEAGVCVEKEDDLVRVCKPERTQAVRIQTAPYPGFPTDMQAQFMAMMAVAEGVSEISETIFENRFMHVAELDRLGADIRVKGGRAIVRGIERLSGTTVMATDLRASASLVLAGLVGDGETIVRRIYHLDRGYEHIEAKLAAVGADIERFVEE
ncbi:UDP-N-acetylglucosamine 1-carboxyvinyltransferase [Myxococcota bacterium]|nr:UDP-N-acetylglucosamine 1-carboxyvinyltransferase [Myxococcota bacterium]